MEKIKVVIGKDMEWQLACFGWDVEELRQELPKVLPYENVIEVTDCEISHLEVKIDDKYYFVLDETGEIIEKGRL